MNKMVEENGVKVHRWTDEELAAMETAWVEVLEENSAADPIFKKVADSYLAYREVYKPWGQAQFLKSTYQTQ
jgi:TRAP-type mannitol/chloroaromatic compound transport system substrate-binding protein